MARAPKRASDSQTPKRVSGAIDAGVQRPTASYDAAGRIAGSAIRTVKGQHDPNWTKTREKAANCRALLASEVGMVLPENFKLADADAFAADLPTTITRPSELLSMLIKKRCDIKRFQTTGSQRSKDTATELEQILTAVMTDRRRGYPWPKTCDLSQNDSLACVITQPMVSWWERAPDWQDPETGTFKAEYQRDRDGKTRRETDKGFRVNGKQSKKAYQEELDDWIANHVPIMYRAFGPQQFTPVFNADENTVDAVIIEGHYQRTSEMASRFLWGEDDHLSPAMAEGDGAPASYGAYGTVEILEYWGYDKRRRPYVSYCVEGRETTFTDGEPAVVDLSPYCSRLPVSVHWGNHWPGATTLDQRGVPFMQPFYQSIRQANAVASAMAVGLFWSGFPAYTTTPDPTLPGVLWNPNAAPRMIDIEPLKIIETPGPISPLTPGQFSPAVMDYLLFLLGETQKAMPADQASGKGQSSGFEKTIARAYAEDAQFLILEGIRQLYEDAASFTLEILTNIAKEKKRPVLVYYAGPVVTPSESDDVSSTRVLLELTPEMAGNQWKVEAQYPPSMSLPERQQSAELVERRLKTRRKHFEDDGDPAPERTAAEIEAEDLVASPLGQEQRWALVAKLLGDDQMAEKIKLMRQQRISQGPDGTGGLPFALAQGFEDILAERAAAEQPAAGGAMMPTPGMVPAGGVPGVDIGAPQGGQMTGMGGPTSAQSALAGAVGGAMQTGPINNAAAAGGVIPPDLGVPLGG